MAYATVSDVQARMVTTMNADTQTVCETLLNDVAVLIDSYNTNASTEAKKVVSCSVVARTLNTADDTVPIGATNGSMSAMGYSQSWTLPSGGTGELYLSKTEKRLLGVGNNIGSYSPIEELVPEDDA